MVSLHSLVGALLLGTKTVLGQQTLYGQCGGLGWTGPTQCVAGACCKYSNDWYSQCLTGDCSPSGEGGSTHTVTTEVGTATTTAATTAATQTSSSNSPGCGKNPTLTSGTKSITVNGKNRQYILRVPNGYDKNRSYKLIFSFHWVGGTMTDVAGGGTDGALWSYYGMQRLANESAILVAPQGLNNGWANSGGEDITFVDQMRQTIENDLCVNQRQRFANGFSYGGAMSFSLACSRAKDFRAVAVMSGGQLSGCSGGSDPIAYLGIHGISDGTLNIAGGRTMRDKFVTNNGCTKITPQEPSVGSKTHIKTQYPGCKAGYPVTWIAFDGGHGPAPYDGGGDSGSRTYTPTEMWTFFSQFT